MLACSLLLGEGYTDPDPNVPGDSGTTQPSGDATSSSDSSSGDGTTLLDGTKEAAVGCPIGTVSFCDDFERDDPRGEWGDKIEENGGTVAGKVLPAVPQLAADVARVERAQRAVDH